MTNEMVKNEVGYVKMGSAMLPCDATINTDSTFDSPLTAKLGETVYYLRVWYDYIEGGERIVTTVRGIGKGKVSRISYATGCAVCLYAKEEGKETDFGAVQELFFHSLEEAMVVANRVNDYAKNHPEGDKDWYETYKALFTPEYPYMLCFPVKPQDIWQVEEDGTCHVANRVIVELTKEYAEVTYQGHDFKSYYDDRKLLECLKSSWMGQKAYEIKPVLPKGQNMVIVE